MIKILLPIDGSELALDAVHHVLRLRAEGLQAGFVLANVQEPTHFYEVLLARGADVEDASRAAGEHALQAAEALLQSAGAEYELEVVAASEPAHALIDLAESYGCDAIVMGMRGKGALREALLGSVSQTVLHEARVPVTIVKHEALEPVAEPAQEPGPGDA